MPKNTFFNLDKEKQQKIIDAAFLELMQYPADEMSVNRIIKTSGISRGSFYQYFEDKEDLLAFILKDSVDQAEKEAERILDEYGVSAEAALQGIRIIVNLAQDENVMKIFRNLFSAIRLSDERFFHVFSSEEKLVLRLSEKLDRQKFGRMSDEEVKALLELGLSVFRDTAVHCILDYEHAEEHIRQFEIQMRYIDKGARE